MLTKPVSCSHIFQSFQNFNYLFLSSPDMFILTMPAINLHSLDNFPFTECSTIKHSSAATFNTQPLIDRLACTHIKRCYRSRFIANNIGCNLPFYCLLDTLRWNSNAVLLHVRCNGSSRKITEKWELKSVVLTTSKKCVEIPVLH